jgi:MoaA/NifB/PqqE/SkfB family radical SAM enzyme
VARSRALIDREQVAGEPRHWVRISRTCNNRCVFCLDSDVQDGTFVGREEVEGEILSGRREGATRLVLSGGEATIHPGFLDFVRYGKQVGYRHVQTITNGRMFAYRGFARRAVEAGLDEVTFSMHGHTPALQDELTGVPGSFAQTVAGIRNVVATGIVVSGDVVLNRRNVGHAREILELFIGLGVREFDILMVVPFGRASPGESDMLFDLEREREHVVRALELSRDPSLHVWTNRMDPRFLEGFEDLIQDPHKLHDEVRGRRDILGDLVEGRPMRCAGDRCSHCFIRDLCSRMREAVHEVSRGVPGILRVDARRGESAPAGPRRVLWIRAAEVDQACRAHADGARSLWLSLDDLRGLGLAVRRGRIPMPERIVASRRGQIRQALGLGPSEVLVVVNRSTAPALGRIERRAGTAVLLGHRPASSLREAVESEVDLTVTRGVSADGHVDIPPCLSGAGGVSYEDHVDASVIGPGGLVDPDAFVSSFIRWHYRVKSLRCAGCVHDPECRGISINHARHAGLRILEPVS